MESNTPTTQRDEKSQGDAQTATEAAASPALTLLHPSAKKIIENYLSGLGVTDVFMDLTLGSEIGDNFNGIIAKLTINGTKDGEPVFRHWIVKTAPQTEMFRMMRAELMYIREDFLYSKVFPQFKTIETEAKVLEPFDNYPGYILSNMVNMEETIIMEDMKHAGYILKEKQKPLDLDHVKLAMKAYGKLHALSFALKTLRRDTWEEIKSSTKNVFAALFPKDAMKAMQAPFMEKIVGLLDPKQDAKYLEKFKKFSDKFIDVFVDFSSKQSDHEVIVHSDCWVNNLLWKYEEGKPEKVCVLDWQQSYCGSPAVDITYFIFSSTTKEFRDEHYESMLNVYHFSLCEHLNALGVNPETCFTFEALKNELQNFGGVGLYYSLCLLAIITKTKEEIPEWRNDDSGNIAEFGEKFYMSNHSMEQDFNTRVKGVIVDFCEFGYLDCLQ